MHSVNKTAFYACLFYSLHCGFFKYALMVAYSITSLRDLAFLLFSPFLITRKVYRQILTCVTCKYMCYMYLEVKEYENI